jgi:hypothetical protein
LVGPSVAVCRGSTYAGAGRGSCGCRRPLAGVQGACGRASVCVSTAPAASTAPPTRLRSERSALGVSEQRSVDAKGTNTQLARRPGERTPGILAAYLVRSDMKAGAPPRGEELAKVCAHLVSSSRTAGRWRAPTSGPSQQRSEPHVIPACGSRARRTPTHHHERHMESTPPGACVKRRFQNASPAARQRIGCVATAHHGWVISHEQTWVISRERQSRHGAGTLLESFANQPRCLN